MSLKILENASKDLGMVQKCKKTLKYNSAYF